MIECDGNCSRCVMSPEGLEWRTADGVFLKEVKLPRRGMTAVQHVHKYDHTTLLCTGAIRLRVGDVVRDYDAPPAAIFIKKGVSHSLEALKDDTFAVCIHNLNGAEAPELLRKVGG